MALWLTLVASVSFASLVASYPALWRRSSDGKHLWQRPVRTEREDLRLGAAVLLVAAAVLAYLGSIAYNDSDRHSPAAAGPKARDIEPIWNQANDCAAFLVAVAFSQLPGHSLPVPTDAWSATTRVDIPMRRGPPRLLSPPGREDEFHGSTE